jgi:hypothetical protein
VECFGTWHLLCVQLLALLASREQSADSFLRKLAQEISHEIVVHRLQSTASHCNRGRQPRSQMLSKTSINDGFDSEGQCTAPSASPMHNVHARSLQTMSWNLVCTRATHPRWLPCICLSWSLLTLYAVDALRWRGSSLQVTQPTYGGLQEHRITEYTATGQKAKPKERWRSTTCVALLPDCLPVSEIFASEALEVSACEHGIAKK